MNQKEQFDEILNECLDRILKGEAVNDCLLKYPQQAKELEPLLKTASAARVFSQMQPRAEFKARARYEFMSAVSEKTSKASAKHGWFNWRWRSAWAMSLVSVIAVGILGSGTVVAANHSMPDSILYPVKIVAENAQLAITTSDVVKAELNAKYANRRVDEINYLASKGDTNLIVAAASHMNNSLQNMTNLTLSKTDAMNAQTYSADSSTQSNTAPQVPGIAPGFGGGKDTGNAASATPRTASAVAPDKSATRTPVAVAAPAPTNNVVVPAPVAVPPATVNATGANNSSPLAAKGPDGSESANKYSADNSSNSKALTSQDKLRKIIDDNFQIRKSQLEKALENASPETRPAIRQAIADSESEYYKSIENLNRPPSSNPQNNLRNK